MQLYIIRHGQSVNNVSMITDGKDRVADPPLTELGHKQADAVAQHLKSGLNPDSLIDAAYGRGEGKPGFAITRLYCSPMLRTLQTALPISKALGLKPQVWIDIHEHGGLFLDYQDERGLVGFPGLTRAEFMAGFPDYALPDTITEKGWWDPNQREEDLASAQARAIRVAAALRKQAETEPNEQVALVTHGTFADCLLKAFFNQLPTRQHFFAHYNTAITRVDFYEGQHLRLRFTNRVDHLMAEWLSA
jgi:2,3-bisphosphoglycerate-dependent phosphoglycerate mutase